MELYHCGVPVLGLNNFMTQPVILTSVNNVQYEPKKERKLLPNGPLATDIESDRTKQPVSLTSVNDVLYEPKKERKLLPNMPFATDIKSDRPGGISNLKIENVFGGVQFISKSTRLQCIFCGQTFPTLLLLITHSKECVPSCHLCDICHQQFRHFRELSTHKRLHKKRRKLSCSLCQQVFKKREDLVKHKRLKHFSSFVNTCPTCNYELKSKHALKMHMKTHDAIQCYHCGVLFDKRSNLVKHFNTHVKTETTVPEPPVTENERELRRSNRKTRILQ